MVQGFDCYALPSIIIFCLIAHPEQKQTPLALQFSSALLNQLVSMSGILQRVKEPQLEVVPWENCWEL